MIDATLLLIAIALAMDSSAISIAAGATVHHNFRYYAVRAAVIFGIFQGGMPVAGFIIGDAGKGVISQYTYWIAFIILAVIGGKMCYESLRDGAYAQEVGIASVPTLLLLAVATSIDALAVGVTFALLDVSILIAALVIALVTVAASLAGFWAGRTMGGYLGEWVGLSGGLILIGIGCMILLEGVL